VGKASRLKREKREQDLAALRLQLQILQAPHAQTDKVGIWRRISPIKASIAFAGVLFGLLTGYLGTVKPRILIAPPSQGVDPQNPYLAPFTLTNDGYLSVYHVSVDCRPAMMAASRITMVAVLIYGG